MGHNEISEADRAEKLARIETATILFEAAQKYGRADAEWREYDQACTDAIRAGIDAAEINRTRSAAKSRLDAGGPLVHLRHLMRQVHQPDSSVGQAATSTYRVCDACASLIANREHPEVDLARQLPVLRGEVLELIEGMDHAPVTINCHLCGEVPVAHTVITDARSEYPACDTCAKTVIDSQCSLSPEARDALPPELQDRLIDDVFTGGIDPSIPCSLCGHSVSGHYVVAL